MRFINTFLDFIGWNKWKRKEENKVLLNEARKFGNIVIGKDVFQTDEIKKEKEEKSQQEQLELNKSIAKSAAEHTKLLKEINENLKRIL